MSKAARVTVVGHASKRWRGAANAAEAERLNRALSRRRAENVRIAVEHYLTKANPRIRIVPGICSTEFLEGTEVGSYGVGSGQPIVNPVDPNNPHENEPANRSVRVSIELVTTEGGRAGMSLEPDRIPNKTRFWDGHVVSLAGAAFGAAACVLTLEIRNPHSGKSATYKAKLWGGGIAKPSRERPNAKLGRFSFVTESEMGFADFEDQMVRVERAGAALIVKASVGYITFVYLGSGAELLPFESTVTVGLNKPDIKAFVASGVLHMHGPNPGDWIDIDRGTAHIPYSSEKRTADSIITLFPTGKDSMNDLPQQERQRLLTFVNRWATRF